MQYWFIGTYIQQTTCMSPRYSLEGELAQLLNKKGYLPDDNALPKLLKQKPKENDSTFILTKLSDDELVKLLNEHPKRAEYDMNDIIKVSKNFQINQRSDLENIKTVQNELSAPVFRLDNREVDPYSVNKEGDKTYNALQKINNMLHSRPQKDIMSENKEMIFDILVSQLKTVCCERNNMKKFKIIPTKKEKNVKDPTEYIFLVVNDEVKSSNGDELIRVDPESLSKNSSVLLLGPVTTPLNDVQTKLVMSRLSKEISRPEYLPLLNQISEGSVGEKNSDILKSLISGPNTRRYIKPHRCNHQSLLTKIYNGPKWIICTGYLNLNTPSLYD